MASGAPHRMAARSRSNREGIVNGRSLQTRTIAQVRASQGLQTARGQQISRRHLQKSPPAQESCRSPQLGSSTSATLQDPDGGFCSVRAVRRLIGGAGRRFRRPRGILIIGGMRSQSRTPERGMTENKLRMEPRRQLYRTMLPRKRRASPPKVSKRRLSRRVRAEPTRKSKKTKPRRGRLKRRFNACRMSAARWWPPQQCTEAMTSAASAPAPAIPCPS
mmetsp:Transcript_132689/g.330999  ORF Transcript_132689/g.330999 Transcript_132689/m.330999 type:complete len:219 (+) Transcript_132689:344-1000(+)